MPPPPPTSLRPVVHSGKQLRTCTERHDAGIQDPVDAPIAEDHEWSCALHCGARPSG